jgi:hypothetical protein
MNCTEFENLSMLYFDGETTEDQVTQLHQHMDICSSCREYFESMKETLELLDTKDEFEIDDKFTADVMAKVNEYEECKARTSMLVEKIFFPLVAVIIGMGALTWYIILNNIPMGFVLYRLINGAVFLLDAAAWVILTSHLVEYIKYINEQLQFILPIVFIIIGIMVSSGKEYKEVKKNA